MKLTVLSTLNVVQAYFNSVTSTMGQISVVVNKLKLPVFVSLGCGIISIIAEIVLIKFFGMGLYAIVLSTTVVMIARYIVFNSFYAAWCLKQPMTYFLPAALKTWLSIPVLIVLMILIRTALPIHSWMGLCLDAVLAGGVGYVFMLAIYGRDVFFVGRGIDYAVCMEGSLKLKEISYIHSEAYAAGELKHGTISLIEQGTLVIGVLTQSELYEKTISNMLECKSRGAYLMGLTTYGKYETEDQVNFTVYVPKLDEHFIGSFAVISLQLLGYYVSVAKGLDVDKPRNLAKSVTVE